MAAAECKGIKAVISESTYPRFEDHCKYTIKGKIFLPGTPEQQAFLSNLKNKLNISEDIAPINCVQKIAPRPILIMHGDADTDIPISAARNLYEKALSPKEFWVIKGGGHNDCYYVDPEKYNQKVLGFIGQNIC